MSPRCLACAKPALPCVVVLLLVAPHLVAGEHVRSGSWLATRVPTAPAPVVRPAARAPSVSVSTSVTVIVPAQPAREQVYVQLRGPDGKVRRFPVEGGREAIQVRQVVLRPGESLTINWVAPR
jgi:hypothetical protein